MDPFQKHLPRQSFDDYRLFFISMTDDVDLLHENCNQYLLEAGPTNTAVALFEYWHDSTARYPRLPNAVLKLLGPTNES